VNLQNIDKNSDYAARNIFPLYSPTAIQIMQPEIYSTLYSHHNNSNFTARNVYPSTLLQQFRLCSQKYLPLYSPTTSL